MPSVLDWSGFPEIDPTLEIPVCLLTVEQLRPISMYKQTDTVADSAQAASQIRVDTGRGSSYHRCPSAAAIALNLISLAAPCWQRDREENMFGHMGGMNGHS